MHAVFLQRKSYYTLLSEVFLAASEDFAK